MARATVTAGLPEPLRFAWHGVEAVEAKSYTCGHCGNRVGPDRGYYAIATQGGRTVRTHHIYLCSHCRKPTFFDSDNTQHPGVAVGKLPDTLFAGLFGPIPVGVGSE